ncbi:hypothetical protein PZ740_03740 [Rhodospirillales bacterium YIM 152171]|uniref:Uncharacterized protein n=1 Tax=Marinimicrococcus flavescens TaxID=3031815 RepID=A0AAP3XQA2_9PROT|nr:hypothetical protein [Marinimicrococcus flavescens]
MPLPRAADIAAGEAAGSSRPLVEMGWVLAGLRRPGERAAVEAAREQAASLLRRLLPGFDWRLPVVTVEELPTEGCVDPVLFLDRADTEREARGWDFALLVTGADLKGYFRGFALAAPSRALSAAVLSTARLAPQSETGDEARRQILAHRVQALALHMLGHLNEMPHSGVQHSFMHDLEGPADLDGMNGFDDQELLWLAATLEAVADVRLEETGHRPRSRAAFYLRAALLNGRGLLDAVRRVRPWLLPLRLGGLTTAAMSALLVLLMTAEAWELGVGQPTASLLLVTLLALAFATASVLRRQRLILAHRGHGLTEQRVVSNVATVLIVAVGMATACALLFATALLLGFLLFDAALIERWTDSDVGPLPARARIAALASALAITIGALGASLEARTYLRHVTRVDEET